MSARPEDWVREYPWTPPKGKTVSQSLAAIRSGLLPTIQMQEQTFPVLKKGKPTGKTVTRIVPTYVIEDVFTKDGLKRYENESKRAVQAAAAIPTKKKGGSR